MKNRSAKSCQRKESERKSHKREKPSSEKKRKARGGQKEGKSEKNKEIQKKNQKKKKENQGGKVLQKTHNLVTKIETTKKSNYNKKRNLPPSLEKMSEKKIQSILVEHDIDGRRDNFEPTHFQLSAECGIYTS